MDPALENLKAGVRRFRSEVFPERAEIYARAVTETQRPHTLFVACADARVDPIELTQSAPGEVFVLRNIGNMVPAYGEMLGGNSAVIEFAVSSLKVQHIVICGHTDCGAMKALLRPESVKAMPTVTRWLTNAHAALTVAETLHKKVAQQRELIATLTEQNVLLQLQHLKTHPSVAGAMAMGELTVSGWVYDIGHGQVSIAENGQRVFTPLA
ncbi:MAG: carbonic anhydrase [Acidobacteriaceae bacterium]